MSNIAVFRIGQLGDTLVSLPAIRAIQAGYPHSNMALITRERSDENLVSPWEVLGRLDIFREVLFYPSFRSGVLGVFSLVKFVRAVRRFKPRILFYLAPYPRSKAQVWRDLFLFKTLCGIQNIYGLEPTPSRFSVKGKNSALIRVPSEVDRLLSIVAKIGLAIPAVNKASWTLPLTETERVRVNALWQRAGLSVGKPVIALGPGSRMPAKRWPSDRFVDLAQQLAQTFPDIQLIILGGKECWTLGEKIRAPIEAPIVNFSGQLNVFESAEILRRCILYIGNDTGTMHLAAAAGIPCIAIFSARDRPGKWDPYGMGHVVLRKDVPCAGCLLTVCLEKGMLCLMEISVQDVLEACLPLLREKISALHKNEKRD